VGGIPWIAGKFGRLDGGHVFVCERDRPADIQAQTSRLKICEISDRQVKKPHGRPQPAPVFRMIGPLRLLLEMHKRSRELDQSLEVGVILPRFPEPQVFQDIVRLVVLLFIKTCEVTPIPGIERRIRSRRVLLNEIADAIALFHRAQKRGRTILRVLCLTSCD
jgi:hypothetical protein